MTRTVNRLKPAQLLSLPEGLHSDGRGLHLAVTKVSRKLPDGSVRQSIGRSWIYRYSVSVSQPDGSKKQKQHKIGLGSLDRIRLQEARVLVDELNLKRVRQIDPAAERRSQKVADRIAKSRAVTFQKVALARIAALKSTWKAGGKSEHQWKTSFETYVYPVIGHLDVEEITVDDVLRVLQPIWTEKTETAKRVQQRMADVFQYAISKAQRLNPINPAEWDGRLENVLPKPSKFQKVENFASVPHGEIHTLVSKLVAREDIAAKAVLFIIWTAARSMEARAATWSEIDLDAGLWQIPGDRMKKEIKHIVKLPKEAVEMLRKIPRSTESDYIFHNLSGAKPISDVTLKDVLKSTGFGQYTLHGMRASFKTWGEEFERNSKAIEFSLAHKLRDQAEASYMRSTLLDVRGQLLEDWANYTLTDPKSKGATLTNIAIAKKA